MFTVLISTSLPCPIVYAEHLSLVLIRISRLVVGEGCDIKQKDTMSDAPLGWAAGNGREGVVRLLIGRDDIDPDKAGEDDQTPLLRAARGGHEGVVKILLG